MADTGTPKEITEKQSLFIQSLLGGNDVRTSAKVTGIGERTAYRWHNDPHIMAALKDARQRAFAEKLDVFRNDIDIPIRALLRNMDPENAAPYVQVAAASKWLDVALELNQVNELEARVTELEAILSDLQRQ